MSNTAEPNMFQDIITNNNDSLATFAAIRLLSCCWTTIPGIDLAYNHLPANNMISALDMQLRYSPSENLISSNQSDTTSQYRAWRAGYPGKPKFGYDGHLAEPPEQSSPDEAPKRSPSRIPFLDTTPIKHRRQSASNLPTSSRPNLKGKSPNQSTSALPDSRLKSFDEQNSKYPGSSLHQIDEHPPLRESSALTIICPAELDHPQPAGEWNSSPSSPSQTRRGAFEKFRQKIRRSKSVSFPATEPESEQHHAADGRERRRANRDRLEEPAQGASPLFKRWGCGRRPSLDLIAVAGMMIAAGELDRLSLRADDVERVRRGREGVGLVSDGGQMSPPGSGDGNGSGGGVVVVPPNTPNTAVGSPASPVSPGGGVGDSSIMGRQLKSALSAERKEGGFAPFPPANTPVFGGSGAVTPSSRSGSGLGLGGGKQRAARPSKLSEVRRFEEVVRRLSVSDSAVSPGARETEEEPVYRLESFPEFPDGGDHSEDRYESGESTPRYKPGEHYFVEGGLQSGAGVGGSRLKLRGHEDCEEVEGEDKGEETHARPDIWRPEDGVGSGSGDVSSTRDSKGSRLSFATSEERRRSWLDVARRATKGRWDHELEECRGLTEEEEGDGKEGLVMKRKHTMANIVELLRSGKGVQKE